MSFIRYKEISGKKYAYEVISYWDPTLKKQRQKVKYLGAVEEDGNIRKRNYRAQEKLILDFGDVYSLNAFFSKTPIYNIIQTAIGEDVTDIWPLLFYCLCHPAAMYMAHTWYKGSFAQFLYPERNVTSQNTSNILRMLSDEALQRKFFDQYWKSTEFGTEGFIIDATALPNRIHTPLNAWGHSDGCIEKQIRFLLVLDKQNHSPLFYRYLGGNIVDVSTLEYTVEELRLHGIKNSFVLLDAGYFSATNIKELYAKKIDFLTRIPASRNVYKALLEKESADIDSVKYAVRYGHRGLFVKRCEIEYEDEKAYAYLVLDPEKKGHETNQYLLECVEEHTNEEEAALTLKTKGFMAFMSSFPIEPSDIISSYYERQSVENVFGFFKADIHVTPLRRHNEDTLRGYLFLNFLALILFLDFKKSLDLKYTVEEALQILRNVKCKVFENEVLIQELNKDQKDICTLLKIMVPKTCGI
jgi:transposase